MATATPHQVEKDSGRSDKKVLALEVRPQKAGFAFFDGEQLLDWGITTYGMKGERLEITARRRITNLLNRDCPRFVVVRDRRTFSAGSRQALIAIVRIVRIETARRSIRFRTLRTKALKRFYAQHGCATKEQIAALIAGWYPELAWKLPPKRKPWQRENHNAVVFDAVAAAMTFRNEGNQNTLTE